MFKNDAKIQDSHSMQTRLNGGRKIKGTVLQPTYLPWSGYFDMIDSTDIYVVFDHVQFERKSWQQRNRIKGPNGAHWLTIPIQKVARDTPICDIRISYDQGDPLSKHWKAITFAYQKAPYFAEYRPFFEPIYSKNYTLLRDLNVDLIKVICDALGIKMKLAFSSELDLNDQEMGKTEKVINLCKKARITCLYEGKSGQDFMDLALFDREQIDIKFHQFIPNPYPQLHGPFVPRCSVIDLLFNVGGRSLQIIKQGSKRESK